MSHHTYFPQGTCSVQIDFDVDEQNHIHNLFFLGGCHGNLQGISRLVEGMPVSDVIARLDGIRCGYKSTSCPDQLSQALKKI